MTLVEALGLKRGDKVEVISSHPGIKLGTVCKVQRVVKDPFIIFVTTNRTLGLNDNTYSVDPHHISLVG